jgi:hypothetical protein
VAIASTAASPSGANTLALRSNAPAIAPASIASTAESLRTEPVPEPPASRDSAAKPVSVYPTWAAVHGLAVLLRGPLNSLTDPEKARLEAQTLAYIGASVS